MIVGRSVERGRPTGEVKPNHRPEFVRVDNLSGKMLESVSLSAQQGEILGLTGLIGSGYEEVPYLLFGAWHGRGGEIVVEDRAPVKQHEIDPAIGN